MEQKDEFYTIKAIGSSSGSIMKVALAETGLVSLVGFVSGLLLSAVSTAIAFQEYAGIPIFDSLNNTLAVIPLQMMLLAGLTIITFGMLVGVTTTTAMLRDMR